MTKIDISTKEVLAAIAAKNAWHPATTQNDPADFDITSADRPFPPVVTKGKKPLKKPPQKAKKGKPQEKFDEPNISEIVGREGVVSYRVQIRRRVDGKQHSLAKTFRHLPNAKKWRNKKLLHIEVNGFLPVDGDVAQLAGMGVDEFLGLDEKASGAAARVIDAALGGLDHLDQRVYDRFRGVEFAATLALGTGEFADAVFVDTADQVKIGAVPMEFEVGEQVDQASEHSAVDALFAKHLGQT